MTNAHDKQRDIRPGILKQSKVARDKTKTCLVREELKELGPERKDSTRRYVRYTPQLDF